MQKDRSGILLILVGLLLILGNMACTFSGNTRNGQGGRVQAAQEKAAQVQVAQELTAQVQAAQEQEAQVQVTPEQAAQGQVAQEQAAQVQVVQEQAAQGQTAQEQVAQGLMAQEKAAQGQVAQGQATQGQETQGQLAQSQAESGHIQQTGQSVPKGCLQIAGSSSMESYISALAEGFMEKYHGITVTVQFTGSSAGIAAVAGGSADIGISSRYLKEEEKALGVTENVVGFDGIAVCVNYANGIGGLTREELTGLYTGDIRNWSELGGNDLPVVVIGREAGSGTRDAFEELLELEDRCAYANELDSTGAVMARIMATPGAVGYVSFETVDRINRRQVAETEGEETENREASVTALCLGDIAPLLENIRDGSYPLYRPFVMAVKGDLSSQNSIVKLWFDYVDSEEGQEMAELYGLAVVTSAFS